MDIEQWQIVTVDDEDSEQNALCAETDIDLYLDARMLFHRNHGEHVSATAKRQREREEDAAWIAAQTKIDAFTGQITPNADAWRYMCAIAWQRQFARGEIVTTGKLGIDLRAGDKVAQSMTGKLYRLLEIVGAGVSHNGKEYNVWKVVSVNTVGRAVHEETIFDVDSYRVWEG
jgi:hypothetical protein